ncbi:hypothetical protein [Cytophaga aurantiaca]|uniref:hypothetical protein n=1 Tax=Cytophaga aurantiaca TaxID=29530 RepID=UPI0003709EE0|nr:hypothetical protein [Cytophaga aurantiaca]
MKILLTKSAVLILIISLLTSCKHDDGDVAKPANPNETELITTVKLLVTTGLATRTEEYAYRDIDGDGGNAPIIDTIRLFSNTSYWVSVLLLDETKNPVDTISEEILANEKNAHQVFYSKIGTYNLTTTYLDFDDHNVPVGLTVQLNTTTGFTEKTNKLRIVLKHQPGLKPTSGVGDESLGETDVEVYFPILIQ